VNATLCILLEEVEMEAKISAEWDRLRSVAVHQPELKTFSASLSPFASPHERTFNPSGAIQEYRQLESILQHEFQVDVIKLKDTIVDSAERHPEMRNDLMKAAYKALDSVGNETDIRRVREELDRNMDALDANNFFEILLLSPQIELQDEKEVRMINLNLSGKNTLSNLLFMRDQQAVTDKGILLSRMSEPQRKREPEVTRLLWGALDVEVVHEITEPATLEGGDFMPMKDFALFGVGNRTNEPGIDQALKHAVNFDEVAIVHQPNHPLMPDNLADPMINIHLDTYFNVASSGVAIGQRLLLELAEVDIYDKVGPGIYEKEKETTDLFSYIKGWGFDIIEITTLEQLSQASNFLTIKDGTILAVEVEHNIKDVLSGLQVKAKADPERYNTLLKQAESDYEFLKNNSDFFPHKRGIYQHGIDAYPIVLKSLAGRHGAAHRMTAALERR
jgi:arginine deiminase